MLCISSKLHTQRCCPGSLKVAAGGIFMSKILANTTNKGFLSPPPSPVEPVVKHLLAHHWSGPKAAQHFSKYQALGGRRIQTTASRLNFYPVQLSFGPSQISCFLMVEN